MHQYLSHILPIAGRIASMKRIRTNFLKLLSSCALMVSANAALSQITIQAEGYSAMGGIQTEATSDKGGGLNVGWIDAGDWMSYSVNLPTAGKYKVSFRVASPNGGGSFRLEKAGGGAAVYGQVNVTATYGWQMWQTITQEMTLPAGQQQIGFAVINGGFNINWMTFEPIAASSSSSVSSSSSSAANHNPVAVLNAFSPDNPKSPADIMMCCTINASAVGSRDEDGDALTYEWEVTGGGLAWAPTGATGINATYKVTNLKLYTVKLTVRDGKGGVSVATKTLNLFFQDYFPSSSSSIRSSSSAVPVCSFSTVIQAEDYETMFGVQTEATTAAGGGLNVGWIDANDWMSYRPINIPFSGSYRVTYEVASLNGNGVIRLEPSQGSLVYLTNVQATYGWQNWTTLTQDVTLAAGAQAFKIVAPSGGYNINWIKIESITNGCSSSVPPSSPSSSSSSSLPTTSRSSSQSSLPRVSSYSSSSSSSSITTSSSSSWSSDRNRYDAPRATTAPIIDGVADAIWDKAAWAPIDVFWLGSQRPSAQDFSGRYKAMWDASNLYLLFDITDDVILDATANPLERYWDDDSVEIFIDENKNGGNHQFNTSAWAYHVGTLGDSVDYTNSGSPKLLNNHITVRRVSMGSKHMWEMSVRIYGENYNDNTANTPVSLFAGKLMGFSACYNDNDASSQRESMMGSVDTQGHKDNMGYINASVFGSMRLIEVP